MSKKLLIIAYTFPPEMGIGGRRWAKFSKYLHQIHYDFRVISNQHSGSTASNWSDDVSEFTDRIIRVPSGYPRALTKFNGGIFHRIKYKLSLWYVKCMLRGSYYDRSAFWKKKLLTETEKQIKDGYNTILVTCAPYRSAYFLTKLKEKYPQVKLIVDLRDPWDMNTTLYGFSQLSARRKAYENHIQDVVMRKSDRVISVYKEVTRGYQKKYPDVAAKFFTIDNGFDKDDFANVKADTSRKQTDKIHFLFAGSFYPGARHILEKFVEALDEVESRHPGIYNRFHFQFYGGIPSFFHPLTKNHQRIIHHGGTIGLHEVYQKIAESDFMMLFLLDEMNYSLSTKFYEYISQNKPVVVFARGGRAGEFVRDNTLGYFADFEKMDNTLIQLVEEYNQGKRFNPKTQIDTSQFDVAHLTKQVIEVIER